MIDNTKRLGRFTSSQIAALMTSNKKGDGFGASALTYIEEKHFEKVLGRPLETKTKAKPLSWGNCLERFVFDNKLGLEYSYNSDTTLPHPDYSEIWAGSPDGFAHRKEKSVVDTKCPFTMKSFCQLVQPLYEGKSGNDAINAIRENHKDGETYYWQLVSNACITNTNVAELIIYMPYQSALQAIRDGYADGISDYYFIWASEDDELPYLPDGGYYKDLNVIRFDVPQSDKDALRKRVELASKEMAKYDIITIAHHDAEVNAPIITPEIN